jgi:hypothetical protein
MRGLLGSDSLQDDGLVAGEVVVLAVVVVEDIIAGRAPIRCRGVRRKVELKGEGDLRMHEDEIVINLGVRIEVVLRSRGCRKQYAIESSWPKDEKDVDLSNLQRARSRKTIGRE